MFCFFVFHLASLYQWTEEKGEGGGTKRRKKKNVFGIVGKCEDVFLKEKKTTPHLEY
jgi:hypothetical protein